MNKRLVTARLIATWFGCGLSPFAPGTVGSAAALAIGALLYRHAGFVWWEFLVLAALLFAPAVWAAGVTARAAKIEDPGFVVVDEVIGQWIALAGRSPAQLEELPGRLPALPALRYLEARARAPVGKPARRPRNRRRRCNGRHIRGSCLVSRGMVQAILKNMALRKSPDSRPQISQVTPPAAIAGGELQIRGKGLPRRTGRG